MPRFIILTLIACLLASTNSAYGQASICNAIDGAIVLNSDNEYIGSISNKFDPDSIFNKFGTYGNKFSSDSIWNKFGKNGNPFASNSAFNKFTSSPPRIVKNKQIIGYLTVNKYVSGAINPIVLGTVCYDFEIDN